MGWVGQKLGVVPSVLLTEIATTLLILAALPLPLDYALLLLPAVGLMLNGTSSVLYGRSRSSSARSGGPRLSPSSIPAAPSPVRRAPCCSGCWAT